MTERTLPVADRMQVWDAVRRSVRPDRGTAVLSVVLLAIATGLAAASTRLLGVVIDDVSKGRSDRLDVFGAAMLVSIVVAGICGLLGRRLLGKVAENSVARLRQEAFEGSMRLRLDTVERVGTADPLSRLTGDIGSLSEAAHDMIPLFITMVLTAGLTLVALLITSPILALAACAGIPLVYFSIRSYSKRNPPHLFRWAASRGEVTRVLHEIGDGAATIRAFRSERAWRKRFDARVQTEWDLEWPMTTERNRLIPQCNIAQAISLTAVLVVAALLYRAGDMTIGVASSGALYVLQAFLPLNFLFDILDQSQMANAAIGRVVGISLADRDGNEVDLRTAAPTSGLIELRDVHFAYSTGNDVLHGVNLTINSGEQVAVVGVSGAGKSTIAKLIAGIHEPTSGEILVGGVAVHNLDPHRRWVALVTQESHVFTGSIADNCRLAQPDETDDRLRDVLGTVHAIDWIDQLPDGLNTIVGREGYDLTLVQVQQLALARVLLLDPLVVILDEATAGLGSESARGIERAFGAVLEGRTVITIAHRLDVALSANRVIVVDHGRIEIGNHHELLQLGGSYSSMWHHWNAART